MGVGGVEEVQEGVGGLGCRCEVEVGVLVVEVEVVSGGVATAVGSA